MFRALEMHIGSLYLALAEEKLEDCIRLEMRSKWERLQSIDCLDSFTAAVGNFFSKIKTPEYM